MDTSTLVKALRTSLPTVADAIVVADGPDADEVGVSVMLAAMAPDRSLSGAHVAGDGDAVAVVVSVETRDGPVVVASDVPAAGDWCAAVVDPDGAWAYVTDSYGSGGHALLNQAVDHLRVRALEAVVRQGPDGTPA